jgi:putative ABC transport system permease protein
MSVDHLRCDLRLAWRGLTRAKAFSAAAILTLALGIAGTTVMFTLVRGVLLRPLPVRDQERLIVAWKELRSSGFTHHPFGGREIEAVARESRLIEMVAGADGNGAGRIVVTEDGVSSYVTSASVMGGFFDVLGVRAFLGRPIAASDDVEGAALVVVISHGLWTRRYGQAPDVIGRRISIGQGRFTIVGVMPPDLDFPSGVELWRTTRSFSTNGPFGDAARQEIDLVGRLRPGVTLEQATVELTALTRRLDADARPGTTRGLTPVVMSFEQAVVGNVRPTLTALLAAVALVLLIATANVANLLLMRGEGRRAELAIRQAVGAGGGRIAREVLVESLALCLVAALVGIVVTRWSLQGILAFVPGGLPRMDSIRIDGVVVAFTILVACAASCVATAAPLWSLRRIDLASQLQTGGRGGTPPAARNIRRALVIAQVAFAILVVAAAGLLTRTLLGLQSVDKGFAGEQLVFVELTMPGIFGHRERHAQFLDRAIAGLQSSPAIAAATPVNNVPYGGAWDVPKFTAEGQGVERAAVNPSLNLESVYPNYFSTLQVELVRGRAFTNADREGALRVAIVSEDVAAQTWPGADPVGRRIKFGGPDSGDGWLTIVGVAASTRYRELARASPTLYLPAAQFQVTAEMFVLRTTAPLDLVASLARDQIRAVDPNVRIVRVSPFSRMLEAPLARPRFNAFLLGIFGSAALMLSTVGLYGVMTAFVRQRDREIALRIALGASAGKVRRLVLAEATWLAGVGTLLGLATAAAGSRIIQGLVHDAVVLDPVSLLAAALLLILASGLASLVPMRRAASVDAIAVLRN